MGLLLSVDDSRNAAYKMLAQVWREQQRAEGDVKIEFHTADEIETAAKMRRIIVDADRKGYNCAMFVVDQEPHDPSKRVLLERITQAFQELCTDLPVGITVGLIVAHSCLECWLLTDVQAIVRFQAGGRGVRFAPQQSGQTERYNPTQAAETITHIMRQVASERDPRKAKRARYEKSRAGEIAQQMQDLRAAARRNQSFGYFFEMVLCDKDGCHYIQTQQE